MKKLFFLFLLATQCAVGWTQTKTTYPKIDIPFKKYVLSNGLTLIVHEDHKAPIIAFNVWYHVGSKNEKAGKTGFAHLFEHLMFNGSEHYNKDYFQLMDAIGATDLNGTTSNDRTNYFETFPVAALDKVLWIESDRMGYMLNAIDSGKLAEQRGVVQNEKRQGENEPYSLAEELTIRSTYPAGHPYSWSVIGSMADLDAASLSDVKDWFKSYYGPNNAVICIAGDVESENILEKVKKYFGSFPAGPPITKYSQWISKMKETHTQDAQDRVPQARIYKTWNVPGWGEKDAVYLDLLSNVLSVGKSSRLYKRLVYDDQIASDVKVYMDNKEIGGQFTIFADAKPGVDLTRIDAVIREELKKVLTADISAAELERAKSFYFTTFIKGMERIGGFGGKSDILAQNETFGGAPDHYKKEQTWIKAATVADIRKCANDWLKDGEYVLNIHPYPDYATTDSLTNRNEQPPMGETVEAKFPAIKEFALSNGLRVSLVERTAVPSVSMSLIVNAGYAADQFQLPGTASFVGDMLLEGTKTKTSLQISDELTDYGASITSVSDLDNTYLRMTALKTSLDASLNLFTDVLLNASFPAKEFQRLQKQQILAIKQEQAEPQSMGLRILPGLLYGSKHAYSNPLTGSGTEESVSKLTREELIKFRDTWFSPNNANLVVVGDIKEEELKSRLEKSFAGWKKKDVPEKNLANVPLPATPAVYIIDKPGALQSIIFAAELSPSATEKGYEERKMANRIIGGEFTSRVNMNLREGKHWSYGAFTFVVDAKGQSLFSGYGPVQTDKTKESLVEMKKELTDYVGSKPASEEEFKKFQENALLELPGTWETNGAVLNSLSRKVIYNRGDDYLNKFPSMLRSMTLSDVGNAAKDFIRPQNLTWVIVGDRSKIEAGIKELNFGPLKFLDVNGKEIK
jgi:zinc protease